MDKKSVLDFTKNGQVTQRGIAACRDFELRDGAHAILGFHDRPSEMWVSPDYVALVEECAGAGWLKVQWHAA